MKKLEEKSVRKVMPDIILVLMILAVFSVVFIYWGNLKSVNFCDEIYSYILSNSENEFLAFQLEGGRWYEEGEIQNILSANNGFQFGQVMLNNKGDVHPPMYYFAFHISSVLNEGSTSKWIGLFANWVFAAISLTLLYVLVKSITKSKLCGFAACLVCISSPALISNNMFLRMYCMFSMWTVLFTYISYRLYEKKQLQLKDMGLYALLAITTFFGFLTQYYFAVFCVLFTCFYCIHKLIAKKWKEVICYVGSLGLSVIAATLFWPTWIRHMFSGYLGGAVKENAFNMSKLLDSVKYGVKHLFTLMYNRLGIVVGIILVVLIVLLIVKKVKEVGYVYSLLGTAVLYSIAIVHLTPAHLLSYRYFFPAVYIAYLALILAVYYSAGCFLDKESSDKKISYVTGVLLLLAGLNFIRPMYDKDAVLFVDSKGTYTKSMEMLESVKDIPWMYYGYENATMTELMYDATMADKFIMVNAAAPFADEEFTDRNCQFILFAGGENSYFGEDVFTSMDSWFLGELQYEELTQKGYMTVYKVTHIVNSGD